MFGNHPSSEQLELYALGNITAIGESQIATTELDPVAAIEEHLLWCPVCLDAVEREVEIVNMIRAAARNVETETMTAQL